jgi:lysophospholipase L1-like esterase
MIRKKFFVTFLPLLITLTLWVVTDAIITSILNIRGVSSFFTGNRMVGPVNKPNFSGRFGGFLDSFSAFVSIGSLGERNSSKGNCKNLPFFLFMGDSTTAGFEVNDDETFVSKINRNCETTRIVGANFGVRGYDTHEVIANYARISRSIKHDAVLYLITDNDLLENMERFPYLNIAKRFGRTFYGTHYLPAISNFEHAYLNFRIFMSDHFYITSTAIKLFEKWRAARSDFRRAHSVILPDQAQTLIELVAILAASVKSNHAKLYVAASPCLADYPCAGPDIERLLEKASHQSKDFTVLPLATELESKFDKGEINKQDMRFSGDMHFSKFGHQVIALELARLLVSPTVSHPSSFLRFDGHTL